MHPGNVLARRSTLDSAKRWIRKDNGFRDNYQVTWFGTYLCTVIDSICDYLIGKRNGLQRVVVQMPTQHSKSLHFSEILPARAAGIDPMISEIVLGYSQVFAARTTGNVKKIMGSKDYRRTFPTRVGAIKSSNVAGGEPRDNNSAIDFTYRAHGQPRRGGQLLTGSIPSPPNGEPGNLIILDDPYKNWHQATALAYNHTLWTSWDGTIKQRQQGEGDGTGRTAFVLPHTPWTSTDLVSRIVKQWEQEGSEYMMIRLPLLSRPDTPEELARGGRPYDLRTPKTGGEEALQQDVDTGVDLGGRIPLWPTKFGRSHSAKAYAGGTPIVVASHYDLNPTAGDGAKCPRSLWRYFDPRDPIEGTCALVCDPNGTEGASSFCSAGIWTAKRRVVEDEAGKSGREAEGREAEEREVIVDLRRYAEYRAKPGYTAWQDAMIQLLKSWPEVEHLIIEKTGHGQSAEGDAAWKMEMQRAASRPLVWEWLKPSKSKWSRHNVAFSMIRGGACALPSSSYGRVDPSWLHTRIDQIERDPEGALGFLDELERGAVPNDRIDEVAMAAVTMTKIESQRSGYDEAMKLLGRRM